MGEHKRWLHPMADHPTLELRVYQSCYVPERATFQVREFGEFLGSEKVSLLKDINKLLVERFKCWRLQRIHRKKFARGASSLTLDVAILHRIFSFAMENDFVLANPVRMEDRPGDNPQGGAEPFTAEELGKLRENAANEKVTQKRKKKVFLPLHTELLFALEAEHARRKPAPMERVLINSNTGTVMTRHRLYQRMLALGKRAGVANAHPHRFRNTLAVDMLRRGASPYDVAKMLGDTIDTVEKHYTPFVRELRERVRSILENGSGLEEIGKFPSESLQNPSRKPN